MTLEVPSTTLFSTLRSYLTPVPTFPSYSGPHPVGSVEYEVPLSTLSLPASSALPSPTIKFRLFYPTTLSSGQSSQRGISWIPEPTNAYLSGYLALAKARPWLSYFVSWIVPLSKYITIPVYPSGPLAPSPTPHRMLIFSHGLVGGMNMHSYLLGSLASHGLICATLEHRDGSCPFSIIRTKEGEAQSDPISFKRIYLKLKPGVYEQRDEQLNIRLLELSALYRSLELLNKGQPLENLVETGGLATSFVIPKGGIDLSPGRVVWTGHSFGGTTMVQLLKSAYSAHQLQNDKTNGEAMPKIAKMLQLNSPELTRQILPSSPLVLLDPWFMPLRSTSTKWLFNLPLPVYFPDLSVAETDSASTTSKPAPSTSPYASSSPLPPSSSSDTESPPPTTIAILSSDFAYHSPDLHSHLPAIFTPSPHNTVLKTDDVIDAELAAYAYPREYVKQSKQGWVEPVDNPEEVERRRQRRLDAGGKDGAGSERPERVKAYVLRNTTHVFASDFAILFKWFTEWFSGQKEGERAVRESVRLTLQAAGIGSGQQPEVRTGSGGTRKETEMVRAFYWD